MTRIVTTYKEILALLKDIKIDGKPYFNYVNIWNDQVTDILTDNEGSNGYAIKFPACFIEFDLREAVQLGFGMKSYPESVIRFHIVTQFLNSRNGEMEQNLRTFDAIDAVDYQFAKNGLSFCSKLIAFENMQDFKHNSIYKHQISYRTNFLDTAASEFDERDGSYWAYLTNPTVEINLLPRQYINPNGTFYINSQTGRRYKYSI